MDRAARGIVFYIVFTLYVFYNVIWIEGLTFTWNRHDTYTEACFIVLCFIGDLIPLLVIPYRLRIGLVSTALVITSSLALCAVIHLTTIFTVAAWFIPKVLLIALAVWMEKGRSVDYIA